MKQQLKGRRSESLKQLQTAASAIVRQYDSTSYADIYRQWLYRHRRCIECSEDYFEKLSTTKRRSRSRSVERYSRYKEDRRDRGYRPQPRWQQQQQLQQRAPQGYTRYQRSFGHHYPDLRPTQNERYHYQQKPSFVWVNPKFLAQSQSCYGFQPKDKAVEAASSSWNNPQRTNDRYHFYKQAPRQEAASVKRQRSASREDWVAQKKRKVVPSTSFKGTSEVSQKLSAKRSLNGKSNTSAGSLTPEVGSTKMATTHQNAEEQWVVVSQWLPIEWDKTSYLDQMVGAEGEVIELDYLDDLADLDQDRAGEW